MAEDRHHRVNLKLDNLDELFDLDRLIDTTTTTSQGGRFNVPHIEQLVDHVQSHLEKLLIGFGCGNKDSNRPKDVTHHNNQVYNCPYDQSHTRISSQQRLESHSRKCRLKQLGYTRQDIREIVKDKPSSSPYQVNIDSQTMNQLLLQPQQSSNNSSNNIYRLPIPFVVGKEATTAKLEERDVPKTNNYLMVNFTPQERLAMYEHSLREAKAKGFSSSTSFDPTTQLIDQQQLAATVSRGVAEPKRMSDSCVRKRPRSHRTSGGGGSNSYTQVLRGLIQAQMDSLGVQETTTCSIDEQNRRRQHKKSRAE